MAFALLFTIVWLAVLVWLLMTLSAIQRNTARTAELLEQMARNRLRPD